MNDNGGPPRRALTLVRQHRLVVSAVVLGLAAVAAVLVAVLPSSGYGEQISGPFGTVSATVPGAGGPPRVIGEFYGQVQVDGGLAVVEAGNTALAARGAGTT